MEVFVLETPNGVFTTNDTQENLLVCIIEEVEPFVRVVFHNYVLCYFVEIKRANTIILKGGNKESTRKAGGFGITPGRG